MDMAALVPDIVARANSTLEDRACNVDRCRVIVGAHHIVAEDVAAMVEKVESIRLHVRKLMNAVARILIRLKDAGRYFSSWEPTEPGDTAIARR
jgi:hypothetical protein